VAAVETLTGERVSVRLAVPAPKSKKRPINQPRPLSWSKLPEGIGLLKITMFPGAVRIDLARDVDRAIADLRTCRRLIVDLRGNTGGGIGGLRLMSHLTPDKRPVGYSLTKKRAAKGYRREELARFGKASTITLSSVETCLARSFIQGLLTAVIIWRMPCSTKLISS